MVLEGVQAAAGAVQVPIGVYGGLLQMITETELEHIAFSFVHGGFDPYGQGGCSCDICSALRLLVKGVHDKELAELRKGLVSYP